MRTICLFIFLGVCTSTLLNAQSMEVGFFSGISVYGGDLSEVSVDLTESHFAYGVTGRYNFKRFFSLRGHLMFGELSGDDLNASSLARRRRNLSFQSNLIELAIIPEFNIYSFNLKSGHVITPYIFAGIGGFYFNPKAIYNGELVDLQPLGTEGQGLPGNPEKYNRLSLSVPNGIGVKVAISPKTTIGFELGSRYTITDYIDDVSTVYVDRDLLSATNGVLAAALSDRTSEYTGFEVERNSNEPRGNPEVNDWYYIFGFSVSIKLSEQEGPTTTKKFK